MVALQTRISPGLLVARKPSPVFTTTAQTEFAEEHRRPCLHISPPNTLLFLLCVAVCLAARRNP